MNRIKVVLEEKGIKQTWLAEKLGKSYLILTPSCGWLDSQDGSKQLLEKERCSRL